MDSVDLMYYVIKMKIVFSSTIVSSCPKNQEQNLSVYIDSSFHSYFHTINNHDCILNQKLWAFNAK